MAAPSKAMSNPSAFAVAQGGIGAELLAVPVIVWRTADPDVAKYRVRRIKPSLGGLQPRRGKHADLKLVFLCASESPCKDPPDYGVRNSGGVQAVAERTSSIMAGTRWLSICTKGAFTLPSLGNHSVRRRIIREYG